MKITNLEQMIEDYIAETTKPIVVEEPEYRQIRLYKSSTKHRPKENQPCCMCDSVGRITHGSASIVSIYDIKDGSFISRNRKNKYLLCFLHEHCKVFVKLEDDNSITGFYIKKSDETYLEQLGYPYK